MHPVSEPYGLFLDDERLPEDVFWIDLPPVRWLVVRSVAEFQLELIRRGLPTAICFDHDLGDGVPDGMACAHWLLDWCQDKELPLPEIVVHSQNPVGAANIRGLFSSYRRFIERHPKSSPSKL